jgi:hypothetical protein
LKTRSNKKGIFIFTRNRLETLNRALNSIQNVPYSKYIIDDSTTTENQTSVLELCSSFPDCVYLGKQEFDQFIVQHNIEFPKFDFLLRKVGNSEWNLGYARNFALLYAKSIALEKVLFTDDDIQVPKLELIEELFQAIESYQFVGANILGLVDDSVLGHIATDLGIINERMLSGGFMVFNPNKIDHFFLNNYNEDWIWLFLQLKEIQYLQTGEVFQELTDPLDNYTVKVMFQEFGEIALDGILYLYEKDSYDMLTQTMFWERMIRERREYLDLLLDESVKKGNKQYREIIEHIKSNSQNLHPVVFQNLFEKYFRDKILFQSIFNSLS